MSNQSMTPSDKKASELARKYYDLLGGPFDGDFVEGFMAALELEEVKGMVEILERSLHVRDFEAPEDAEVKKLGERIGFGALLDSAVKGWHESAKEKGYPPGGAFTVGYCHSTVESSLTAWKKFRGEK